MNECKSAFCSANVHAFVLTFLKERRKKNEIKCSEIKNEKRQTFFIFASIAVASVLFFYCRIAPIWWKVVCAALFSTCGVKWQCKRQHKTCRKNKKTKNSTSVKIRKGKKCCVYILYGIHPSLHDTFVWFISFSNSCFANDFCVAMTFIV